jgi:hypothetical protein
MSDAMRARYWPTRAQRCAEQNVYNLMEMWAAKMWAAADRADKLPQARRQLCYSFRERSQYSCREPVSRGWLIPWDRWGPARSQ